MRASAATILPADEVARRIAAFEANGYRFEIKGPTWLAINRASPFDAAKRFGEGWSIWRGPPEGDGLRGDPEEDLRSLEIRAVDLGDIAFTHFIGSDQVPIDGERKLRLMRASGKIGLDAGFGETLDTEPGQLSLRWLNRTYGITWFELTGTVLRRPDRKRFLLAHEMREGGLWRMTSVFVSGGRHVQHLTPYLE